MKRTILVIWFLAVAAIGGAAWWYLFSPGSVPDGQRPLSGETEFRQAFHAGVGKPRVVAVLSPTTPSDLIVAQYFQALLMEYENDSLEAHVVWHPATKTDWAPTTDAMGRVWDARARQYWDNANRIPGELGGGQVFIYARGAGLDSPAIRSSDWKADLPKIREILGQPTRKN